MDIDFTKDDYKFIQCQCSSEGLMVRYYREFFNDNNIKEFYFSLFNEGFQGRKMYWKDKLRLIWKIIKTGQPYTDQLILHEQDTKKLVDFLNEKLNEKI